jgi:hypothetical protein
MRWLAGALLLAAACNRDALSVTDLASQPISDMAVAARDLTGADLFVSCPTQELAFTQAMGCANDGSVEFCIRDGDAALRDRIKAIAPAVTCAKGSGRAKCNVGDQLLCSLPTQGPPLCTMQHGALTDEGWYLVCSLAAMPEIKEIVHTIFE